MTKPATVVIFAYRRPLHLQRVLQALSRQPEAPQTSLRIFVDGARGWCDRSAVKQTRRVAEQARGFADVKIQMEKKNQGLARSIVGGVTQILGEKSSVIVLEDDIVPLAGFLAFMNHALHAFASVEEVMSVSATQYAHPPPQDDTVRLLPITCSWGWATWSRAWIHFPRNDAEIREFLDSSHALEAFDLQNAYPYRRLLEDTLSGRGDTWAVRWYYACFRRGGLTVHPPASYVLNTGRDGSGQHDMGPVAPATEPVPMERLRWPSSGQPDLALLHRIILQWRQDRTLETAQKTQRRMPFWKKPLQH